MENIIKLLPVISPTRRYWFIRTKGGVWYENFLKESYIGISWDKIAIDDIKLGFQKLCEKIEEIYKITPTHTANQLIKFSNEVKTGDIVLIPSKNSSTITFGEVLDDKLYEEKKFNKVKVEKPGFKPRIITFPEKRKNVNWLKTIERKDLDSELYNLIFSHHTISDATPYADYIDKTLHRFFIKNNQAHLILEVKTTNGIKAKNLFRTGLDILNILDDFNLGIDEDFDSNDIEVKINVQSPGDIQFSGKIRKLAVLGILLVGICGGGFKISRAGVEIQTDGLIKSIIQYQDKSFERKAKEAILKENINKLEIKTPDELSKVYESLNTQSDTITNTKELTDSTTNKSDPTNNKNTKEQSPKSTSLKKLSANQPRKNK